MDVSDRIAPCTRMLSFSLIISKNPDRVFIIYSFMRLSYRIATIIHYQKPGQLHNPHRLSNPVYQSQKPACQGSV